MKAISSFRSIHVSTGLNSSGLKETCNRSRPTNGGLTVNINAPRTCSTRRSMSQEEHDHYESDYRETEASLKLATANRDLARLNLDWCEVRAPSTGQFSRRMVDPGNLIKADDTVLTSIVSLDPLYVYFDVHEQAMLRISRLMREGKIKVKTQGSKNVPVEIALSDEVNFPHSGVVDFTDNRVDINTGTLRFRAQIQNPADKDNNRYIVPGLFVRVRLRIGDPHPAIMIREQSLVTDQGQKGVFVISDKDDNGNPRVEQGATAHRGGSLDESGWARRVARWPSRGSGRDQARRSGRDERHAAAAQWP